MSLFLSWQACRKKFFPQSFFLSFLVFSFWEKWKLCQSDFCFLHHPRCAVAILFGGSFISVICTFAKYNLHVHPKHPNQAFLEVIIVSFHLYLFRCIVLLVLEFLLVCSYSGLCLKANIRCKYYSCYFFFLLGAGMVFLRCYVCNKA